MKRWYLFTGFLLFMLLCQSIKYASAACTTNYFTAAGAGGVQQHYYVCATDADKPSSSVAEGDQAYVKDVDIFYLYTGSAWVVLGGARSLVTVADATSITCNWYTMSTCDQANTQATGTLTVVNFTGTCVDGQRMILRLKSTNVQTFAWDTQFRFGTDIPSMPTSTGSGKTDYFGFMCNLGATKIDFVSVTRGY